MGYQVKEERLSTPNVHSCIEGGIMSPRKLSGQGPSSKFLLGPSVKRDQRLSQPTLVTGDYFPGERILVFFECVLLLFYMREFNRRNQRIVQLFKV